MFMDHGWLRMSMDFWWMPLSPDRCSRICPLSSPLFRLSPCHPTLQPTPIFESFFHYRLLLHFENPHESSLIHILNSTWTNTSQNCINKFSKYRSSRRESTPSLRPLIHGTNTRLPQKASTDTDKISRIPGYLTAAQLDMRGSATPQSLKMTSKIRKEDNGVNPDGLLPVQLFFLASIASSLLESRGNHVYLAFRPYYTRVTR